MAKDAKGHGSNTRGTGAQGMRLAKTHVMGPHSAKVYKNPEWGEIVVKTFRNGAYQSKNDYHTNDMADAHGTAQEQLTRWTQQDAKSNPVGDKAAASALGTTGAAPVHDSMNRTAADVTAEVSHSIDKPEANLRQIAQSRSGYNEHAVNKAIASSNRSGRRIGGKEASAIHRLLKGR